MNKERINDLVDILGEEFARIENTFVIRNNEQLAKYLENPRIWKQMQLSDRERYKTRLLLEAKQRLELLNQKAEKVFLLSYREVDKDIIEITEKEIRVKNLPSNVKSEINAIKKENGHRITDLVNAALKTYTKNVRLIDTLSTPDNLYETVKRQMVKGVENGLKVVYKNGRLVTWKAYMEMNIRTTIHQEMANHQIEVSTKVGQIFFIVDSFSDCADDHADFQGKVYFNEDAKIPPEVMKFIRQRGIKSMQEVMFKKPYLTTRPNCRHNFHAITLEEAMGNSASEILKSNGFQFGTYKKSNYQKLQEQRYNERQIRKYKLRMENARSINGETGVRGFLPQKIAREKVAYYQDRQRKLIKSSKGVLKRDYERESAKTIVDNLGVKYDYRVVDGELRKK